MKPDSFYRFKKTGKRNEIFLATKFGITMNPDKLINGEPDYAKKCIDESLRRLGGGSIYAFSTEQ